MGQMNGLIIQVFAAIANGKKIAAKSIKIIRLNNPLFISIL